jgi:hypothetical protein
VVRNYHGRDLRNNRGTGSSVSLSQGQLPLDALSTDIRQPLLPDSVLFR